MLEPTSSRSASPCPADPVPGRGGLSAGGVPERALFQEAGQSRISPPGCREPSGLLPTMQWLPRSGLTPWPCWEPLPPRSRNVVLAGRATHVPQAAVTSGIQRTVTVTSRRPVGWVHAADLGWGSGPKLHGRQGVTAGIGLAVPRPADPVPGRGGPERRRRPRPDGLEPPMPTKLLTGRTTTPGDERVQDGRRSGLRPA
jgi:hypothetical protein